MPVSNHVRRDPEGLGHSLIAPKGFDQFSYHAPLSQIVRGNASPNYHNLFVADECEWKHLPLMDSQDKNGGPNYLREWRVFRGISQSALAELVGTNANMIQYLETGERGLSAKWLRRLAPALDTTPGMLLDHNPSELDADILEIWGRAGEREKRQISEVARALLKTG